MRAHQRVHALAAVALALLCAGRAPAQDDNIETAIATSRSNATTRELRTQTEAAPPQTKDKHELAIFYHRRGAAHQRLGNYDRAIEDLKLALANHQPGRSAPQQIGDRWRIQNDLGNALEARGDLFAALEFWNRVAQESRQGNQFHYHLANLRIMTAHSLLARWVDADQARAEAEAALTRLRASPEWVRWGYNALDLHNRFIGDYLGRQGNNAAAERAYRASLDAAEKHRVFVQRTFATEHQETRIALGNVRVAKTNLGDILATQGKYGEAEMFARAGLQEALAQSGFNTTAVSHSLAVVGWARFQQGDFAGAERFYRHALAAIEASGVAPHSTALASRRAALANVLIPQGRWNEALRLFEERDRGLRADAAQFKRFGSNYVTWALAVHKSGQPKRAADMAARLVSSSLKRPVPDRWAIAQRRGVLGMALAASGKRTDALHAFQQSIPDLMRRDQDGESSENTGVWRAYWQRIVLEAYLDLLGDVHAAQESLPDMDLADESFRIADLARGSSVQEAIVATAARALLPDNALNELARRDQDTLNHLVALNRLLGRYAAAPDRAESGKVINDMHGEIERLRGERAVLRAEMKTRYPEYADLIDPKPSGIEDVRKALAPGEALVAIYLGESRSYVWTIARDAKPAFRVVPAGRAAVERDVQALRKATDFGDGDLAQLRPFDLARANQLYHTLLEVDAALWQDAKVLNVIPHGALGELPFALLVTAPATVQPAAGPQAGYADVPWLAHRVAIAQLPSANAFAALRRMPAGRVEREAFIGFGDPVFAATSGTGRQRSIVRNLVLTKITDKTEERLKAATRDGPADPVASAREAQALLQAFSQLGALPDTSDELREIAVALKSDPAHNVFVQQQATERNVKQAKLFDRRVIAFATHGIAAGELLGLDQPALALSNPALTDDADNDGFLTMEEVLGLKLDADWVVLSACNTASADGNRSEAVSGLGRAFFYAGARSLLVSNWAVETTSARKITTELFRRQAGNPRMPRVEALRQSMLALMQQHAIDPATNRERFSYSHPVFWAPFSLVGDSGLR
jgi:CHAT domain-containing protein